MGLGLVWLPIVRNFLPLMLSALCIFLSFIIVLGESVSLYKVLYHAVEISFQLFQNLIFYWQFMKSSTIMVQCILGRVYIEVWVLNFFLFHRHPFSLSHWICIYLLLSCHWISHMSILFIPSAFRMFSSIKKFEMISRVLKICFYHKIYI